MTEGRLSPNMQRMQKIALFLALLTLLPLSSCRYFRGEGHGCQGCKGSRNCTHEEAIPVSEWGGEEFHAASPQSARDSGRLR